VAVVAYTEEVTRGLKDGSEGFQKSHRLIRGDILYEERQFSSSVFLLEAGLIKLTRALDDQRQAVLRVVRPGELFGDRLLSAGPQRESTAEALCQSVVYEIPREEFQAQFEKMPGLWEWVTQQLESRLEDVERRIQLVSFYRVEQRVLLLLADLAEVSLNRDARAMSGATIPLAQSEIAQLVGATRETVCTTLNVLERRGLLRLGRKYVVVESAEHLRQAAAA